MFKLHYIFALVCAMLSQGPLWAQSNPEQLVIGTYPFLTNSADQRYLDEASSLSNILTSILSRNPNFQVVSRGAEEILDMERKENLNPEYIRGKVVAAGKAHGATHVVAGVLDRLDIRSEDKTTPGFRGMPATTITTYTANVSFTLTLVDMATGLVKGSKSYTVAGRCADAGKTGLIGESQALEDANKRAGKQMVNWVVTMLPSDMRILKVETADKKGAPSELWVKSGTDAGITRGNALRVVSIELIEGTPIETEIAMLRVTEAQTSASRCNVTKGKAELQKAMAAGQEVKILIQDEEQ